MLRIVKEKFIPDGSPSGIPYIEAFVNSSFVGDFPTGVATGSKITEVDTGKVYLYDEDGDSWEEQSTDGAGGAGYDAIIQLTQTSATTATGEIVKGDFDTVYGKAQASTPSPISVLVGVWDVDSQAEVTLTGSTWAGDYGGEAICFQGFHVRDGSIFSRTHVTNLTWDADGVTVGYYNKAGS